jgi:hypothetical protein
VTCDRLVVFSSTNKTYHHDITEILLKVEIFVQKMTKYIFQRTQQTLIVLMMRNVRNVMINWKNFLILERAGLKKE